MARSEKHILEEGSRWQEYIPQILTVVSWCSCHLLCIILLPLVNGKLDSHERFTNVDALRAISVREIKPILKGYYCTSASLNKVLLINRLITKVDQ
jgi:hypothetical protein